MQFLGEKFLFYHHIKWVEATSCAHRAPLHIDGITISCSSLTILKHFEQFLHMNGKRNTWDNGNAADRLTLLPPWEVDYANY